MARLLRSQQNCVHHHIRTPMNRTASVVRAISWVVRSCVGIAVFLSLSTLVLTRLPGFFSPGKVAIGADA